MSGNHFTSWTPGTVTGAERAAAEPALRLVEQLRVLELRAPVQEAIGVWELPWPCGVSHKSRVPPREDTVGALPHCAPAASRPRSAPCLWPLFVGPLGAGA